MKKALKYFRKWKITYFSVGHKSGWLLEVHWNSTSVILERCLYFPPPYRLNGMIVKRENDWSKPFLFFLIYFVFILIPRLSSVSLNELHFSFLSLLLVLSILVSIKVFILSTQEEWLGLASLLFISWRSCYWA